MEIINLANRKEVEVLLNGRECVMSLALKNINHFQETNKIGFQKALEKILNDGDFEMILKLIYSITSDKKTGKILGAKFFKNFDELDIINSLTDIVIKLLDKEIPKAKSESEKK